MKKVQIGFKAYGEQKFVVDADVWHCNGLHDFMPKEVTPAAWFQIHREDDLYKESADHIEWLTQEHPFPIYMSREFYQYPASVKLPRKELADLWTLSTPVSFASSFSWMVAMAIYLKYEAIWCSGIEFVTPREAWIEAPNFMAWLGIAAGYGIDVDGEGRIFEPYMYGVEERKAPVWLPMDVAQDVILDQVDEGRRLRSEWLKQRWQHYS